MARVTVSDLVAVLEQLQQQMADVSRRLQLLEGGNGAAAEPAPEPVEAAAPSPVPAEPLEAGITEEELLAISAALGAFLGVKPHIKRIRLISTSAWAQQGRVSIQASHRLQG